MFLKKIIINCFRNLKPQEVTLSPRMNCILGENAQGKTNFLEALYFLRYKKSFRKNTSFPHFFPHHGENSEIYLGSVWDHPKWGEIHWNIIANLNQKIQTHISFSCKQKEFPPFVFINPFDAHHFFSDPAARRNWVDHHLSEIDEQANFHLKRYQKAVKNRNILLKAYRDGIGSTNETLSQIQALDKVMIIDAFELVLRRKQFSEIINHHINDIFYAIYGEKMSLYFQYLPKNDLNGPDEMQQILNHYFTKDVAVGNTLVGPHKDDYTFVLEGNNAIDFASLGQQKTLYLSLVFAYIHHFRYKKTPFPVILIDDVSGELDQMRWTRLTNFILHRPLQVVMTTANEKLGKAFFDLSEITVYQVDQGLLKADVQGSLHWTN